MMLLHDRYIFWSTLSWGWNPGRWTSMTTYVSTLIYYIYFTYLDSHKDKCFSYELVHHLFRQTISWWTKNDYYNFTFVFLVISWKLSLKIIFFAMTAITYHIYIYIRLSLTWVIRFFSWPAQFLRYTCVYIFQTLFKLRDKLFL